MLHFCRAPPQCTSELPGVPSDGHEAHEVRVRVLRGFAQRFPHKSLHCAHCSAAWCLCVQLCGGTVAGAVRGVGSQTAQGLWKLLLSRRRRGFICEGHPDPVRQRRRNPQVIPQKFNMRISCIPVVLIDLHAEVQVEPVYTPSSPLVALHCVARSCLRQSCGSHGAGHAQPKQLNSKALYFVVVVIRT